MARERQSREERERHVYIVGKSGSGKSTTLFNLATHDITSGEGAAVIDPTVTLPTQMGVAQIARSSE